MSTAIDRYEELETEISELRAIARRLRDEGDIGIAAETDAEASRLEELVAEGMSPEEQSCCLA